MRKDVLLRPAGKIKQNPMGQEIKTGAGEFLTTLAGKHLVEAPSQSMKVQYVRRGIPELLFAEVHCPPIRTLLLLRQVDIEQVLAKVAQPVPIGEGAGEA